MTDRRQLLMGAGVASPALASQVACAADKPASATTAEGGKSLAFTARLGARCRVMVVNDLSGDIDGLFALVHALPSSAAEVRGIVGTAARQASETTQLSVD